MIFIVTMYDHNVIIRYPCVKNLTQLVKRRMPYTVRIQYFSPYYPPFGPENSRDRIWCDKGATTWDPSTLFPGKDVADNFGNLTAVLFPTGHRMTHWIYDLELSNPPDDDHPSSYSLYGWDDTDDSVGEFSPAEYGFTVSLSTDKTFSVDYLAPGNVQPKNGPGTRYISVGSVDPDGNVLFIYICDIITAKIQNLTDGPLPYAVNSMTPQAFPLSLSDFPASNVQGTIPKQKIVNVPLFNVFSSTVLSGRDVDIWDFIPGDIGLYFYSNSSTSNDSASAGIAIDSYANVAPPVNGTNLKIDYSEGQAAKNDFMVRTIIFTVTGTVGTRDGSPNSSSTPSNASSNTPSSTTGTLSGSDDTTNTSSDSEKKSTKMWMWIGIGIGIIALIVVIALLIHHHKSQN